MFNMTVEFSNGTSITDNFIGPDDFNTWVDNTIKDFGPIVYIRMND